MRTFNEYVQDQGLWHLAEGLVIVGADVEGLCNHIVEQCRRGRELNEVLMNEYIRDMGMMRGLRNAAAGMFGGARKIAGDAMGGIGNMAQGARDMAGNAAGAVSQGASNLAQGAKNMAGAAAGAVAKPFAQAGAGIAQYGRNVAAAGADSRRQSQILGAKRNIEKMGIELSQLGIPQDKAQMVVQKVQAWVDQMVQQQAGGGAAPGAEPEAPAA